MSNQESIHMYNKDKHRIYIYKISTFIRIYIKKIYTYMEGLQSNKRYI